MQPNTLFYVNYMKCGVTPNTSLTGSKTLNIIGSRKVRLKGLIVVVGVPNRKVTEGISVFRNTLKTNKFIFHQKAEPLMLKKNYITVRV